MKNFIRLLLNRFIFIVLTFIIVLNHSCTNNDWEKIQAKSAVENKTKLKGVFLEYVDTLLNYYYIDSLCLNEMYIAFDGIIWDSDSGYSLEFGLVFTPKNFIDYKEFNRPSEKKWISFLMNNLNNRDSIVSTVLFLQFDKNADCLRPCYMGDDGVLIVDSIYSFTPRYSNLRNNCFFQMQDTTSIPGSWERIDNKTHLPLNSQ